MIVGALNALLPAIASDIFGTVSLPKVYPFLGMSLAMGSLTLATLLFSNVYEHGKVRKLTWRFEKRSGTRTFPFSHPSSIMQTVPPPLQAIHKLSPNDVCLFADCFNLSYFITASCCALAALLSVDLARRTRHDYQVLIK